MQRLFLLTLCVLIGIPALTHAAYMSPVSDVIVSSQPGSSTSHIITFRVVNPVPASGTITISPESGAFTLPLGFSFNDVDVAVSSGGPYGERELAASPNALNDGVSVVGASAVQITLNSSDPIPAASMVRVVLGRDASHQSAGTRSPINALFPASYRIRINTASGGTPIDDAKAMVALLYRVTASMTMPYLAPVLSNGLPAGTIAAGSATIELSLQADKPSTCRYATSSGVTYDAMPGSFSSIAGLVFYTVIGGHQDNTAYNYYVRCADQNNLKNLDDYVISFQLDTTPSITSSDGTTLGGGGSQQGVSGNGGVGSFPNGSSVLFQSRVTFSGFGPVNSTITILRDGKTAATKSTEGDGAFSTTIGGLDRGTYTFVAYGVDAKGAKTSRFSSTLTVGAGTTNTISGAILSPTVSADSDSIDIGASVHLSGVGIPNSKVGILVRNVPVSGEAAPPKEYTASTTASGVWEFTVPARDFSRGTYQAKVKSITAQATSEYSPSSFFGYGESPSQKVDTGNGSDLNGDGKVNLVDFSILLTHWNETGPAGDINGDGAVNLADFSILLFNWTG